MKLFACKCASRPICAVLLWGACYAQTTEALITGRVVDSVEGSGIAAAEVRIANVALPITFSTKTAENGQFWLPPVAPGIYNFSITGGNLSRKYQRREIRQWRVPVSARIDLTVPLRPMDDLWDERTLNSTFLPEDRIVARFYGPDVDFSRVASFTPPRGQETRAEATLSDVISPREVENLPLPGRDVYATLVLEPGITSSAGLARGLGFSVNGQRYTASSFLLDGVENNLYLTTGPMVIVAPEAMQEYRVSLANFTAEFGKTTGFIANAVTRSGGNAWHGLAYFNLRNDLLNANEIARRYAGYDRAPLHELQPGVFFGGPIVHDRLFVSASADYLRYRSSSNPQKVNLPSQFLVDQVLARNPGSESRRLFENFRPPVAAAAPNALFGAARFDPPESLNRGLGLVRLDYVSTHGSWFMRFVGSEQDRPDFFPSPYRDFSAGVRQSNGNLALAYTHASPRVAQEARAAFARDWFTLARPYASLPAIAERTDHVSLPSSQLLVDMRQAGKSFEGSYNIQGFLAGRHAWKAGGSLLVRSLRVRAADEAGQYTFEGIGRFRDDKPTAFDFAVKQPLPAKSLPDQFELPIAMRRYRYSQVSLFLQDSFRITSRLVLNAGVRFETFPAPVLLDPSAGVFVDLGFGESLSQQVNGARLISPSNGGASVYSSRSASWAIRQGISWSLNAKATTVVRAAYGIFHDRPFDNVWLNSLYNGSVIADAGVGIKQIDYLEPGSKLLNSAYIVCKPGARLPADSTVACLQPVYDAQLSNVQHLIGFAPQLQNPGVQSAYAGVVQQISREWSAEAYGLGSFGRHGLVSDRVNRKIRGQRADTNLWDIYLKSDDGWSRFYSLASSATFRGRKLFLRGMYTWSRSFDNQSDPLAGDFDLLFASAVDPSTNLGFAAFTQSYDFRIDRAASDFDQRHSAVLYSIWSPSGLGTNRFLAVLTHGWNLSQTGVWRSGRPYTVYGDGRSGVFLNNRANQICGSGYAIDEPEPGFGRRLLRRDCFAVTGNGNELGSVGRNAIYGPGTRYLDVSIARSFAIPKWRESARLVLRADSYNVLNHANLNNPENKRFCPEFSAMIVAPSSCVAGFGVARYGRMEQTSFLGNVKPFVESARQVQIILRLEF